MLCSGLFTLRGRLHYGQGPGVLVGLGVRTLHQGRTSRCSDVPATSSLPASRCGCPQCTGGQEAWLESVAMPSATISLRGDPFRWALGLKHSDMLTAQRCGYNVV